MINLVIVSCFFSVVGPVTGTNATQIVLLVQLDNQPGTLSRDGQVAWTGLQDGNLLQDNGYVNNVPGSGLSPGVKYTYVLTDSTGATHMQEICARESFFQRHLRSKITQIIIFR